MEFCECGSIGKINSINRIKQNRRNRNRRNNRKVIEKSKYKRERKVQIKRD